MCTDSPTSDIAIRPATAADRLAIRRVHEAAFGRTDEADLVDALRAEGATLLSLVAETNGQIVANAGFSRMWIESARARCRAVALAPVAVVPERQRRGIGGALIRHGIDTLRGMSERIVIVLGHPAYYSRFGFSIDQARTLQHPFSPGAYMALALDPGALDSVRGRVRYPRAFAISTDAR